MFSKSKIFSAISKIVSHSVYSGLQIEQFKIVYKQHLNTNIQVLKNVVKYDYQWTECSWDKKNLEFREWKTGLRLVLRAGVIFVIFYM